MATGFKYLSQQAGYQQQGARSAALRRAAASGRTNTNDVEAIIAPIEQRTAQASSQALKQFALSENERFNQLEAQADFAKASSPLPPTVFEKLGSIGSVATAYGQNKEFQEGQREFFRSIYSTPSAPGSSAGGFQPFRLNPSTFQKPSIPSAKLRLFGATYNPQNPWHL